jgi:cation diffusion facilitator family transporter
MALDEYIPLMVYNQHKMDKLNWEDDGYFITERRDLHGIRRVLVITMLLNFAATVVKVAAGVATGALSVVADGLDSLFDGLSNVAGLAGMFAASKPPDAEHPYGHRKFETIAALVIALLLFITCWQLISVAIERLREPQAPLVNWWVICAMLLGMAIQAATSIYELRQGRRLNSEILIADAMHTRASILVSASVLVGLLLVRLGYPGADPILTFFVAAMIAKIGVDILRDNIPVLVDRAAVDPQKIAAVTRSVAGVISFHRVRSRGAVGSAAVDLHVRVSPRLTVQQANAIGDEVRRRLLEVDGINDVTVHLEAAHEASSSSAEIYATLQHAAGELGLRVHEAWTRLSDGHLVLEAHVGVDPSLTLGAAHELVDQLERDLRRRLPDLEDVHTHIEMASDAVLELDHVPAELEGQVRQAIEQIVADMPEVSSPHNLIVRSSPGEQRVYTISVECKVSADMPLPEAHRLSTEIERSLTERLPGAAVVIVHLEPPGSA